MKANLSKALFLSSPSIKSKFWTPPLNYPDEEDTPDAEYY